MTDYWGFDKYTLWFGLNTKNAPKIETQECKSGDY